MNATVEGTVLREHAEAHDPAEAPLAHVQHGGAVAAHQATSLLSALTQAAMNPQVDMEKVKQLFAMHKEMCAIDAEAAFNAALARAQAKILPVLNDRLNDHTSSRYATLAALNRVVMPELNAEGLSVSFNTETKNDEDPIPEGYLRTIGWMKHAAGHKERYHLDLPPDDVGIKGTKNKTDVQAHGSTNEYARRYLLRMMVNASTYDDRDSNAPRDNAAKIRERREQEEAQQKPKDPPAYAEEDITKNLPGWTKLVKEGKKTPERIVSQLRLRYTVTDEQVRNITAALPKEPA